MSGRPVVAEPNPWKVTNRHCQMCGRQHCCYFCQQDLCFPPMTAHRTICARCGDLIDLGDVIDPRNEAMEVCLPCWVEILAELAVEATHRVGSVDPETLETA